MDDPSLATIFHDERQLEEFIESISGAFPPTIDSIWNDPEGALFVSATYEKVGANDDRPGFTSYWRNVVVQAKGEALEWQDWGYEDSANPGRFHYEGTGDIKFRSEMA